MESLSNGVFGFRNRAEAEALAAHLGMPSEAIVALEIPREPLGLAELTREAEQELALVIGQAVRFVDYVATIGEMSQDGWQVVLTHDEDGTITGLIGTSPTL